MAVLAPRLKSIWGNFAFNIKNNVWDVAGSGAPTNGTSGTGASVCGIGSRYTDFAAGIIYINTNTLASPTWSAIGLASGALTPTSILATGSIRTSGPTAGIGYATGAGGAVTQGTSRTTTVVSDTPTGAITLFTAAGSTTPATFTVTCAACAATDIPIVVQKSGTDLYTISVTQVAAGSFNITFNTKSGTTSEAPVFNYALIKGVAA